MPISQDVINLYDRFTHGTMSRRAFMDRLSRIAGSTAAAAALLPLLQNDYARAAMVAEDDARLDIGTLEYEAEGVTVSGYLARPKGDGKLPAIVVIHENRGLNPHMKDVARRLAVEGFLVLAPDILSPLGGTPEDSDKARDMIRALDGEAATAQLAAAVPALEDHPQSTGKVGAVGFCWGGGMVNQLAVRVPELDAGVAYYGRQPDASQVAWINAPLLLHYAGLDERINAGIADYEAALKAEGKQATIHVYEGVNHAFNNDTNAARYDKAAADLAWQRTVAFFKETLT
ncbi:dienelactone hydrolase family protein [Breoghania sp. L-A4]|uniref:dienelactone hydrolase family protein n=1 Tax=Breoghania sp. L-A4 TaxID=2304600 RepID=UPI000E35DE53|nr:dienelactone hydrolase family protein [Breoghania sp. L-A4]AXS41893.1 dienelactone hydrolase family protein [Breoghania sp. L-A4]